MKVQEVTHVWEKYSLSAVCSVFRHRNTVQSCALWLRSRPCRPKQETAQWELWENEGFDHSQSSQSSPTRGLSLLWLPNQDEPWARGWLQQVSFEGWESQTKRRERRPASGNTPGYEAGSLDSCTTAASARRNWSRYVRRFGGIRCINQREEKDICKPQWAVRSEQSWRFWVRRTESLWLCSTWCSGLALQGLETAKRKNAKTNNWHSKTCRANKCWVCKCSPLLSPVRTT